MEIHRPMTYHATVREAIAQALVQLLQKQPLEEISVTQIVQAAGVGRASFYRNFSGKKQVLLSYVNDLYDDFFRSGQVPLRATGTEDYRAFLLTRLRFIWDNQALFTALRHSDLLYEAFKEMNPELMLAVQGVKQPLPDYLAAFCSGACAGIIRNWIDRGFLESAEELTALTLPLLQSLWEQAGSHK